MAGPVPQRGDGLHAAALFDVSGRLCDLQEDIGCHNALNKLIGAEFRANRLPLTSQVVIVSGRLSFELFQKAAMAGGPAQSSCRVGPAWEIWFSFEPVRCRESFTSWLSRPFASSLQL